MVDRPASGWAGVALLAAIAAGINVYMDIWTAAVALALLAAVSLMWTRTAYELTEDSIRLTLGYRRIEIPVRAIRSIEHSARPGSIDGARKWPSFALSLTNFWVIHAHDGRQPIDIAFSPSEKMVEALGRKVTIIAKDGTKSGGTRGGDSDR